MNIAALLYESTRKPSGLPTMPNFHAQKHMLGRCCHKTTNMQALLSIGNYLSSKSQSLMGPGPISPMGTHEARRGGTIRQGQFTAYGSSYHPAPEAHLFPGTSRAGYRYRPMGGDAVAGTCHWACQLYRWLLEPK